MLSLCMNVTQKQHVVKLTHVYFPRNQRVPSTNLCLLKYPSFKLRERQKKKTRRAAARKPAVETARFNAQAATVFSPSCGGFPVEPDAGKALSKARKSRRETIIITDLQRFIPAHADTVLFSVEMDWKLGRA